MDGCWLELRCPVGKNAFGLFVFQHNSTVVGGAVNLDKDNVSNIQLIISAIENGHRLKFWEHK
jgi:hypothetical protein